MEAYILDVELEPIAIVNDYGSFLWIDRYSDYGDFELVMHVDADLYDLIDLGHTYIQIAESDRAMIIEDVSISQNVEGFATMNLSGRSVESILLRRVLTTKTTIDSTVQNGVKKLLNKTIISPSNDSRRISNFSFKSNSSSDPTLDILEVTGSFPAGTILFDAVKEVCDAVGCGFKVTIKDKGFVFSVYRGQDRTIESSPDEPCVFSPTDGTLSSTKFICSTSGYSNVAVVAGAENEKGSRKIVTVESGDSPYGIYRHEEYVDANDISQTDDNGKSISSSKFTKMLRTRGKQTLKEHNIVKAFEGEIGSTDQNVYGEDYELGDIVDVISEYGIAASARVLEVVLSTDENGFTAVPTFGEAYNVEGKVNLIESENFSRINPSEFVPLVGEALNGILG